MSSLRLWQHAQGVHMSTPDGVSTLKQEVDADRHPSPRSYLRVSTTGKGKIRVLQWRLTGDTNHTGKGSTLTGRWLMQNKLNGIFGDVVFWHYALF